MVFNGLSEYGDTFHLANSYKIAGDTLVNAALKNEEVWELFCPTVYNYRHAIELYMKAIIGRYKKGHDLIYLLNRLKDILKNEFNSPVPEWFENLTIAFNDFDPRGVTFRYGGYLEKHEAFVDFAHLKTLMSWVTESFDNIRLRRQ